MRWKSSHGMRQLQLLLPFGDISMIASVGVDVLNCAQ